MLCDLFFYHNFKIKLEKEYQYKHKEIIKIRAEVNKKAKKPRKIASHIFKKD